MILPIKIYTTFLSLFMSFACFAQQSTIDCTIFKEGKFYYITSDSTAEKIIIERKGKQQKETHQNTGVIVKYKVKWINDCEYQLKQTWSNNKQRRKHPNGLSTILITDLMPNSYMSDCSCTFGENKKPLKIKVFKIS
ncbi:MAG: hypothetical protein KA319_04250 [Ferruginibacter sp.]|nr:hypothetical protein [Ferruginibacter sp.]